MPDKNAQPAALVLIRHAALAEPGRLFGRTDAPARVDVGALPHLQHRLSAITDVVSSPALRCRQSAAALWPQGRDILEDARLWEQDFGAHEGMAYEDLPDIGQLTGEDLAAYAPPGGESFNAVCARAWPALQDWAERAFALKRPIAFVVHAGIVRAAIGKVLGTPAAALAFEIDPLSITRFRVGPAGLVAITSVNEPPR